MHSEVSWDAGKIEPLATVLVLGTLLTPWAPLLTNRDEPVLNNVPKHT